MFVLVPKRSSVTLQKLLQIICPFFIPHGSVGYRSLSYRLTPSTTDNEQMHPKISRKVHRTPSSPLSLQHPSQWRCLHVCSDNLIAFVSAVPISSSSNAMSRRKIPDSSPMSPHYPP
eukprot:2182976-Amphidinium_carterae.2